jgi:hypothetical protein
MRLENIIANAKKQEEEKMGYSFKIPITLKKEFENMCKKHKITMSSMLIGMIENAVVEDRGFDLDIHYMPTGAISKKITELRSEIFSLNEKIENGPDNDDDLSLQNFSDLHDFLRTKESEYLACKNELSLREHIKGAENDSNS